jgi:hypothetical protein
MFLEALKSNGNAALKYADISLQSDKTLRTAALLSRLGYNREIIETVLNDLGLS